MVTGRLLGQPCSVHGDQAAVLGHLLDQLSDLYNTLNDLVIAMFIFSRGKRIHRISYFVYLGLFQNLHGFVQGPLYHMRHRDPLKSGDT